MVQHKLSMRPTTRISQLKPRRRTNSPFCTSRHIGLLGVGLSTPPSACQELHNGLQNTRMPYLSQGQTSRRNLFDFTVIKPSLIMARLLVLVNHGDRIDVSARYTVSFVWSSEINSMYSGVPQGLSQEIA
jgi:hypothetical protein